MRGVRPSVGPQPASWIASHSSVLANVESAAESVLEATMDDVAAEKEIAIRGFDVQTNRTEKVWLTIFHVEEMQIPFHAVSLNHEDDNLWPL